MKNFKLFLLYFFIIFPIYSEKIIIEGMIINQTKKQKQNVEKIEIIALTEEGMNNLITKENQKADFSFSVDSNSPLMIRVHYQNETYVSLIHQQELKKEKVFKQIPVYEVSQNIKDLSIHSGIQVLRTPEGLEMDLVYAIQNKTQPPYTIQISDPIFYIPENSEILSATFMDEAMVPVNISLTHIKENQYSLKKSFKPGNSEINIKLKLKNYQFSFAIDPVFYLTKQNHNFFKVLIWKPEDAIPEVYGAELEKKNIPNLGNVYLIHYKEEIAKFKFNKGSFFYSNPMEAYYIPIFDTWWKTLLAVILGIILFFLILSFISSLKTHHA